jgi:hypothetical protein
MRLIESTNAAGNCYQEDQIRPKEYGNWAKRHQSTSHPSCRHTIYKTNMFVSQMLALANDRWSLLNHPNISPIWLLRSSISTELIPAFAMPWFGNGNVLDFIHRHPHIDKLNIVRLEPPWFYFSSKLSF